MLKDGLTLKQVVPTVKNICKIMNGKPVSIELTDSSASASEMIEEAKKYRKLGSNIVVKVPLIPNDIKSLIVIKKLGDLKIPVNITAIMTYEQLALAALASRNHPAPSFISLFWARSMEDHERYRSNKEFIKNHGIIGEEAEVNFHPSKITAAIGEFLKSGEYDNTKLIVGSIRNVSQVGEAFAAGANIVTIVPKILEAMLFSQRTLETNADFDASWKALKKQS